MIGAAAEIIRNDGGITALWKGIGPALVLVINPVLQVRNAMASPYSSPDR